MAKLLIATVLLVVALGEARRLYYPDTKDPNAIVFEGPTNFKGSAESKEITDNEVIEDYSKLIDPRVGNDESGKDECPPGFVSYGGVCFPND